MTPLYTTWVADVTPDPRYPPSDPTRVFARSVLPPFAALTGVVWALSPDLTLTRDGQPVAQVIAPGGSDWRCAAVWVDPSGVVVVSLIVALPSGIRFVAQARYHDGGVADQLHLKETTHV